MQPASPVAITDARRPALGGLIDYAGLFPPASLDMAGAVAGYRAARRAGHGWIVDRFVCPAARLDELAASLVATMVPGEEPWRLSVLLRHDPDWLRTAAGDLAAAESFVAELGAAVSLASVEVKAGAATADEISRLARRAAAAGAESYVELPGAETSAGEVTDVIEAIGAARRGQAPVGAKLRCGGVEAALFPDVARVASVITACRDDAMPFKATAGLHHPVRHDDPRTGFAHHGFLNLLAAATLAASHGLDRATIARIVAERDPAAFRLSRRNLGWGRLEASLPEVEAARRGLFRSYGSCDLAEPVEDLVAMGVLEAA